MRLRIVALSSVLLCLVAVGCASTRGDSRPRGLVGVGYAIAENLIARSKQSFGPNETLIVTSFVNVNNLYMSSSFGRMLAEQVASGLTQMGHQVIDVRIRQNSVLVSEGHRGEFMLSRDMKEISKTHNASAVVVGTYADAGDHVYLSARIVRPADSIVVSTTDHDIRMQPDEIRTLLYTN